MAASQRPALRSQLWLACRGDVEIGIFPEDEEIIVGLAGGGLVTHHHLGPAKLEMGESAGYEVHGYAPMFQDPPNSVAASWALPACR